MGFVVKKKMWPIMSFLSQFQLSIILGLVVTNDKMTNKFWHSLHNLHSWPSNLHFTSLLRNVFQKRKKENLKHDCQSNPFHSVHHAAEAHLESRSPKCHNPSPCDSWHQMTSEPLSSSSSRNSGGSGWVFVALWIALVGARGLKAKASGTYHHADRWHGLGQSPRTLVP